MYVCRWDKWKLLSYVAPSTAAATTAAAATTTAADAAAEFTWLIGCLQLHACLAGCCVLSVCGLLCIRLGSESLKS